LFLIVASAIVGVLATLATALAFFGSAWWGFDWLANLRWYLLWMLVIAAIIYSLTAKGWLLIVFVVALGINAMLILPLWLGSQPESTGEDSIVVAHLDATGGFDDRTAATDWLRSVDADVLLIAQGSSVTVDLLTGDGSDWSVLLQPDVENTAGHVILGKQAWDVAVTPTGVGSDTVIRVTVGSGDVTYDILTAYGPTATNGTDAERLEARLDTIASLTDASPNPVVVVGNLGTTRWTHGMRALLSDTVLRDATEGQGYLSTSSASSLPVIGGWIGLPLDLVLMSEAATPIEIETGPDLTSDHLPVRVIVAPTD
jgi:endonuclease/exonuclease/phosphatase (EEP) superfamily protein YafD